MKITINSKLAGKFEKRFLNNREHIVTNMIPIVGDSIMNQGFYPLAAVQNSFEQLHFLPAPNGHPKVNNQLVSAFHPLAVNSFNIGGMVRNPTMDGNNVVNEFWLDIEIANQSDDGQELIRRIEQGEEVGVSTGLNVNRIMEAGEHNGEDYQWVANNLQFDHVAILLNEKAAGSHVGTALQTNDANVMVVNCAILDDGHEPVGKTNVRNNSDLFSKAQVKKLIAEVIEANTITSDSIHDQLRTESRRFWPEESWWVWIIEVFPIDGIVIFDVESRVDNTSHLIQCTFSIGEDEVLSLNDDKTQVIKQVEFVEIGGDADVNNSNPQEDNVMGDKLKPTDKKAVTNTDDKLNVENAVKLLESKGFAVNTKEEAEQLKFFTDNRAKFESIINREEDELVTLRKNLVANSDLTDDDVESMGKDMLVKLGNSFTPAQDYSANGGFQPKVVNSDVSDDDFEDSYTTITENGGK